MSRPPRGGGVATTGTRIRYPDATVTCSPIRGSDRPAPDPVVVFEVVSGGNARTDRLHRMREDHAVPSIRHDVLVERHMPVPVRCSRRNDEPWTAIPLPLGDVLALPEIDIDLAVADIFDGVTFDDDGSGIASF